MRKLFCFGLVLLISAVGAAQEKQSAPNPGKYLLLEQVIVPEGKAVSHPALMAQVRRAADSINAGSTWIAVSNLTGDLRGLTYMSFCEDFASIEKDFANIGKIGAAALRNNPNFAGDAAEHQVAPRAAVAVFRPDLSYQPDKVPPAEVKYWSITTMYLRAGHLTDFADQIKEEIELLKRGGLDHHVLVYQVLAGVPSSGAVFYVMNPMRTLAEMDRDDSEKASAVFTPAVRHRFELANQQMISNVESDLLVVRPELSRPPASYVAANPELWTVKEPPIAAGQQKDKTNPPRHQNRRE